MDAVTAHLLPPWTLNSNSEFSRSAPRHTSSVYVFSDLVVRITPIPRRLTGAHTPLERKKAVAMLGLGFHRG